MSCRADGLTKNKKFAKTEIKKMEVADRIEGLVIGEGLSTTSNS